jgi:predicted branched-subunit amino acid permease
LTHSNGPTAAGFVSPRAALLAGIGEALRVPAWVLGASYIGFGSMIRESGLGLEFGVLSTVSMWALPGQIVLVEMVGVGASALAIALVVSSTGVRFMPMTVTLLPVLRRSGVPR